jgi:hypothetical protein
MHTIYRPSVYHPKDLLQIHEGAQVLKRLMYSLCFTGMTFLVNTTSINKLIGRYNLIKVVCFGGI